MHNQQKPTSGGIDYKYQLQRLLNKVNRVTSAHRHGQAISIKDLDSLSNRQIEVEEMINMKDPHSKIKITKKPTSGGLDSSKTIRPPKRSIVRPFWSIIKNIT